MTERPPDRASHLYRSHRMAEIIGYAVWLYSRFPSICAISKRYSLSAAWDFLPDRRRVAGRLGSRMRRDVQRRLSDKWHLDGKPALSVGSKGSCCSVTEI